MVTGDVLVPRRVLPHLLNGIVRDTARDTLELMKQPDWKPDNVIHLGDPFGLVLAWLWKSDPDLAVSVFADLMAQLRHWDSLSTKSVTVDDVLEGLFLCLQGLTDQEQAALTDRLRTDVPQHFGRIHPNSTQ